MIYFIKSPKGPIKIGTAVHVGRRLKAISMGHPGFYVMAIMKGGHNEERELHHRFATLRIGGEWFRPADELAGFIKANGKRWDAESEPKPTAVVRTDRPFLQGVATGEAFFYDLIKRGAEEDSDPVLKVERAIGRMVETMEYCGVRPDFRSLNFHYSAPIRDAFISEMDLHGVTVDGCWRIIDEASMTLFGVRDFPRDHMTSLQLSTVNMVEVASTQKLRDSPTVQGNDHCLDVHTNVAGVLSDALKKLGLDTSIIRGIGP